MYRQTPNKYTGNAVKEAKMDITIRRMLTVSDDMTKEEGGFGCDKYYYLKVLLRLLHSGHS